MKKLLLFLLTSLTTPLIAQQSVPLPVSAYPGVANQHACYNTPQAGNPILGTCTGASNITTLTGTTPAIVAGQDFTITLSGNATPTISGIITGIGLTGQICQPPAGGPYTWTWPAAIHGGGTIGTTASTCSQYQFKSFNGTSLVSISTGTTGVAP